MMNGNDFTDAIWAKYDEYNNDCYKDKFFRKHLYKNTDYIRNFQTLLSFIIICISTVGIVYASNYAYKEIIQTAFEKNNSEIYNISKDYEDMILEDGRLYKKIMTYEDYLVSQERLENLVEMSKEDFENNFVLVIVLERIADSQTYISDIYANKDTLFVELKKYSKTEETNENNNVLSAKIEKSLDRNDIKISVLQSERPLSENYVDLLKIPSDYTIEQAINDNCFVISDELKVISKDEKQLDKFIENTQNKKPDFIRVVQDTGHNRGIIIRDIEYKNGKYLVCHDESRYKNYGDPAFETPSFQILYKTGYKIEEKRYSLDGEHYHIDYQITEKEKPTDEYSGRIPICTLYK